VRENSNQWTWTGLKWAWSITRISTWDGDWLASGDPIHYDDDPRAFDIAMAWDSDGPKEDWRSYITDEAAETHVFTFLDSCGRRKTLGNYVTYVEDLDRDDATSMLSQPGLVEKITELACFRVPRQQMTFACEDQNTWVLTLFNGILGEIWSDQRLCLRHDNFLGALSRADSESEHNKKRATLCFLQD